MSAVPILFSPSDVLRAISIAVQAQHQATIFDARVRTLLSLGEVMTGEAVQAFRSVDLAKLPTVAEELGRRHRKTWSAAMQLAVDLGEQLGVAAGEIFEKMIQAWLGLSRGEGLDVLASLPERARICVVACATLIAQGFEKAAAVRPADAAPFPDEIGAMFAAPVEALPSEALRYVGLMQGIGAALQIPGALPPELVEHLGLELWRSVRPVATADLGEEEVEDAYLSAVAIVARRRDEPSIPLGSYSTH